MGILAYDIEGAANAAGVQAKVIIKAIRDGELACRESSKEPLILRCDLKRWLKTLPAYALSR